MLDNNILFARPSRILLTALSLVGIGLLQACTTQYAIYDADNAESTGHRELIVAGCVPQSLSGEIDGPVGSVWVQCNDLDYAKDDIEETDLVSCKDHVEDGVLHGIKIREVSNRKWKSFRIACAELGEDGRVVPSSVVWTPKQFDFSASGDLFETTVPDREAAIGIFEVYNKLQLRESLLSIGIDHLPSEDIFEDGVEDTWPENPGVSPRIPDSSPVLIGTANWLCPPGMALTGAAVGHIPKNNGKHTRPIYILGECRTLFKEVVRD